MFPPQVNFSFFVISLRAACSSVFSAFLGIRIQMSVHKPWTAPSASSASAGRILMRPSEEESGAEFAYRGEKTE